MVYHVKVWNITNKQSVQIDLCLSLMLTIYKLLTSLLMLTYAFQMRLVYLNFIQEVQGEVG